MAGLAGAVSRCTGIRGSLQNVKWVSSEGRLLVDLGAVHEAAYENTKRASGMLYDRREAMHRTPYLRHAGTQSRLDPVWMDIQVAGRWLGL